MAGGHCGRAREGILAVNVTEISLPLQAALEISQKDTHQSEVWMRVFSLLVAGVRTKRPPASSSTHQPKAPFPL